MLASCTYENIIAVKSAKALECDDEVIRPETIKKHDTSKRLSAEFEQIEVAGRQGLRMDLESYDSFSHKSDEEYFAFVAWLSDLTASELREAKGNPEKVKAALCRYYKRGYRANLTPGELIDFLGVSSPSILDMAGYSEEEGDSVMQISDRLTEAEIEQTILPGSN